MPLNILIPFDLMYGSLGERICRRNPNSNVVNCNESMLPPVQIQKEL